MADRKYWGMRVKSRGRNGIFVTYLINGDFAMYLIKDDEKVLKKTFSKSDLVSEIGKKPSEKLKNIVRRCNGNVRIVDITITPSVRKVLASME